MTTTTKPKPFKYNCLLAKTMCLAQQVLKLRGYIQLYKIPKDDITDKPLVFGHLNYFSSSADEMS